ncbi:hypothetical protein [Clostridium sp. CCUG 7971]|uniref:hypothetical protein n=1 Tax=Clostridium sp. CCUG 7971 TaxID=2811414 RepID=UPI001ABACD9A|nr:hypothetical protein [Clostridium sp. CCUG 7971]MBO3443393.1 hypothetical protein [Clostridium sp. CCUG 7971]
MSILENMTILEAAELIRCEAEKIAKEKGITNQEAWKSLLKDIKIKLEGEHNARI